MNYIYINFLPQRCFADRCLPEPLDILLVYPVDLYGTHENMYHINLRD